MVVIGTGSRKDRSTFSKRCNCSHVNDHVELSFMAYVTLDIKWLLSYSNNSFTHSWTLIRIFSTLGAPKIVWNSETPDFIFEGKKPEDLEIFFSGWPIAFEVHWYKDDKIITNGTEGIYHSEDRRQKNGEETLRSRLSFPPGREELEGVYKCSAKNTISGGQASAYFQYIFVCKQKPITI